MKAYKVLLLFSRMGWISLRGPYFCIVKIGENNLYLLHLLIYAWLKAVQGYPIVIVLVGDFHCNIDDVFQELPQGHLDLHQPGNGRLHLRQRRLLHYRQPHGGAQWRCRRRGNYNVWFSANESSEIFHSRP